MPTKNYNRRAFLGKASCAAIGSTTFFSSLFHLQAMSTLSLSHTSDRVANEDYKALVCILLSGGNDSYNMLIPSDTAHYSEYNLSRSNLAIPQEELIPLAPIHYNEKELSLHPAMLPLKEIFDDGKLAFIANIGTLVQPTTKSQYQNGVDLPFSLFSHADQVKQWATSIPQTNALTGWGGRLADLVYQANTNQEISMNISLSGSNLFQLGNETMSYSILPGEGSVGIHGFDGVSLYDQVKTQAIKSMLEKEYQDIFRKTYAETLQASQNTHELFSGAIGTAAIQTPFSIEVFPQALQTVARTMKVRSALGAKRQIFFVRFDGWDHHDELMNNQAEMLEILSQGMRDFQYALAELDLEEAVTTFTISDFGRTLRSNGNGTDHAWGGNVMVMGGQVKGKEIYGSYPSLALNGALMLEGGVLIPQVSTDEYFAELALWFGAARTDLSYLFPNIGNFYDVLSEEGPLGFMAI